MRARAKTKPEDTKAPGAFLSDGSYSERAELMHRGQVDGLVRALVRGRREGRLTPIQAASLVDAAKAHLAFPSIAQWSTLHEGVTEDCLLWPRAAVATAAESAVKFEGRGANGHWCGERFLKGPTSECADRRHATVPDHDASERFRHAIESLGGSYAVDMTDDEAPPMEAV